jgi:hypothetical protein
MSSGSQNGGPQWHNLLRGKTAADRGVLGQEARHFIDALAWKQNRQAGPND